MNITIVYLILYFTGLVIITWLSSRRETANEYLNSAKRLTVTDSTWTTFASLLTGYNFVLGVTFAYLYGFWYLMAFVGAAMAFVALYFFYKKRLAVLQKDHDLFSIGDYFGIEYGISTKILVNLILCVCLFLFLILQMYINTGLFSFLLHLEKSIALLLTSGIVCIYLWIGGFKASVKTDIFQGILMLPIILIIYFFPIHFSWEKIPAALDISQFWFAVGLALLQFFSLLAQAESFQRVFAVKDSKTLKKSLIAAFVLLTLVAGSIAYIGINFKFSGVTTDPSNLFTEGVLKVLPQWLSSLLVISLIAAFMGTIDSSAFALGILAASMRKNITHDSIVKSTQRFTLIGLVLSAIASLYLFSFLQSVFALISIISVIGATLLVSMFFKLKTADINIFLIVGMITFISGLVLRFITDNPLTAIIPTAISLIALCIVLAYRKLIEKNAEGQT